MRNHSSGVAKTLSLYVSIALLLSPVVAFAGPLTLYTDRDAFLAAANPDRVETFDDPAFCFAFGFEMGGLGFPCRADFGDVDIVYAEMFQFLVDDVVPVVPQTLSVVLPATTYAAGLDILLAANGGIGIQFLCDTSDPGCETVGVTLRNSGPNDIRAFFGVVPLTENVSLTRITATANGGSVDVPQYGFASAVLDNLVMRVPEPATALLLAAGLVGVCWRRRTTK